MTKSAQANSKWGLGLAFRAGVAEAYCSEINLWS